MLSPEKNYVFDEWKPDVNSEGDISILKFENDEIPLTKYIRPVCLWDFEDSPNITEEIAVGWGRSLDKTKSLEKIPKKVKMTMQSNDDCRQITSKLPTNESRRTFCAGTTIATDVCLGVNGNGFFIKANNLFYLKGIASASGKNASSCDSTNHTIYTDVQKFKAWIEKVVSGEKVVVKNATGKTLH